MIREAMVKYLQSRPARKLTADLWVSDLGMHPYKAMARVLKGEQSTFELKNLEKMQCGTAFEEDTLKAVNFYFAGVVPQFPLYDSIWTGYADFIVGHGTPDVTIVEHKGTDSKWWDYRGELVKSNHCCQLWLYGQLYEQMYQVKPRLILFYRAWAQYAELEIEVGADKVFATGEVNGEPSRRVLHIQPAALKAELEDYYRRGELPSPVGADTWNYPEEAYNRLMVQGR